MPRNARKQLYSNFFHVMVQGINKEYIFQNEREIKTYLKYMKEKLKERDLQIIAYCMMNNHAHFLIYTEKITEISKLMSQVNTKYAIFYNTSYDRCGFVFKGRYKSEEILTLSHLISCINYIHNNPVKANICKDREEYKYSSYNEYKNATYLLNTQAVKNILEKYYINLSDIFNENYKAYRFIEHIEPMSKKEKEVYLKKVMKTFLREKHIKDISEIIENKIYLKEFVLKTYIEYHVTQKDIAEILQIDRVQIHRMINEKEL